MGALTNAKWSASSFALIRGNRLNNVLHTRWILSVSVYRHFCRCLSVLLSIANMRAGMLTVMAIVYILLLFFFLLLQLVKSSDETRVVFLPYGGGFSYIDA